ncbi:MAG: hypothetical protein JSS10_04905 [Verrucomicrobia bacterium]|nr:hypothetical protein [Verrucomicrobiota bacterium]
MSITILPFSPAVLWDFIHRGAESEVVKDLVFAQYPYDVIANRDLILTKEEIEKLHTLVHTSDLSKRVQHTPEPNCFRVDKYLTARGRTSTLERLALERWRPLESFFWKAAIISGGLAAVLTFTAFRDLPGYLVIAAATEALVLTFLAGYCGARYLLARDQVAYWQNPGLHLAKERAIARKESFPDLWQNKSKFLNRHGGLLKIEIHSAYVAYFRSVAEYFLKMECKAPQEQYDWIAAFLSIDPHPLDSVLMDELFNFEGYHHYTRLSWGFDDLKNSCLIVQYDTKGVEKAIAKFKEEEPARAQEFEEYGKKLLQAMHEHYQKERRELAKNLIQDSAYLQACYEAGRKLLLIAYQKIVQSQKNVQGVTIPSRPVAIREVSHDFYSLAKKRLPLERRQEAVYLQFLEEVQKLAT